MKINRAYFRAPGPWPPPPPDKEETGPAVLPYEPLFRHELWYIDIRYLRRLEGRWGYSLCIIEGYSRKILAGMASEYQDELAVVQLLPAPWLNTVARWGLWRIMARSLMPMPI